MRRLTVMIIFATSALARNIQISDRSALMKSLGIDCAKYSFDCFKLDIVSWVDKLDEKPDISIFSGVTIARHNSSARTVTINAADLAREFNNDPSAGVNTFLLQKLQSYLNTHCVKVDLLTPDNSVVARKGGGGGFGGGGKKGDGGYGALIAAAFMMKGTLFALALGALAAMAGKALMTGLISLVLSAILGLKSMGGGGKTTYEIVAKPKYTHASTHSATHEDYQQAGQTGYGRDFDTANMPLPMALQQDYRVE